MVIILGGQNVIAAFWGTLSGWVLLAAEYYTSTICTIPLSDQLFICYKNQVPHFQLYIRIYTY